MAKYLVEEAVEEKDITAYLIYAYFLLNGEGPFEQDKEKGFDLYLKAADQGCSEAAYFLGLSYFKAKQYKQAMELLS